MNILDLSALLALIKNEPGSAVVENLLGHVVMSSINIAEVATHLFNLSLTREQCRSCILPLLTCVVPFDQEPAFQVAALRQPTKHKGLSLGHRACLALSIMKHFPIYSSSPMEIYYGLYLNPDRARRIKSVIEQFVNSIKVLSFDERDAIQAA